MAVDPKNPLQPSIDVYVDQLCEELRELKRRTNTLESQVIRAPGAELLQALPAAVDRKGKLVSFDPVTGDLLATAPASGDVSEFALEIAARLKRDGSEAMLAELLLSGNAVNALGAVPKQQLDAAFAVAAFPGVIVAAARLTTPAGWLLVDGKTIGNAASGATARANADTWLLFEQVWAFPSVAVPIFDSVGVASVRGASAAADFAAGKRLALFTPDGGAFLRMWAPGQTRDAGRAAGSVQEDEFEAHYHDIRCNSATGSGTGGGGYFISDAGVGAMEKTRATPSGGSETRPYNLSMPHYIFLGVAT